MCADTPIIRRADDADLNALLDIFNAARADAGCFRGLPVDHGTFAALVEGEAVFLAEVDGGVAGFVSIWVADRFIHHLYVAPQFQSRGIGSALLRECQARHGRPLSLKCDVRNIRARRFYRNKGWLARETGNGDDGPWERLYSP